MSNQIWGTGTASFSIEFFFPWEMWKKNRNRTAKRFMERKRAAYLKARIRKYSRRAKAVQ